MSYPKESTKYPPLAIAPALRERRTRSSAPLDRDGCKVKCSGQGTGFSEVRPCSARSRVGQWFVLRLDGHRGAARSGGRDGQIARYLRMVVVVRVVRKRQWTVVSKTFSYQTDTGLGQNAWWEGIVLVATSSRGLGTRDISCSSYFEAEIMTRE